VKVHEVWGGGKEWSCLASGHTLHICQQALESEYKGAGGGYCQVRYSRQRELGLKIVLYLRCDTNGYQ